VLIEKFSLENLEKVKEAVSELYRSCSLRIFNNNFMHDADDSEEFDLMIMRVRKTSLFWHCIYYFIEDNLPYDFILPYEDTENVLKYKFTNQHISVSTEDPRCFT
jgi:hypothetical protein